MSRTITVSEETYESIKDQIQPEVQLAENYVIVRTRSAGVHAGELESQNGSIVVLTNARRLWYWSGAASLSELSVRGVKKPKECKFPCEVGSITLTEAIEVIPCTTAAQTSIKGVAEWSA